jgi:hypothetical protein
MDSVLEENEGRLSVENKHHHSPEVEVFVDLY